MFLCLNEKKTENFALDFIWMEVQEFRKYGSIFPATESEAY